MEGLCGNEIVEKGLVVLGGEGDVEKEDVLGLADAWELLVLLLVLQEGFRGNQHAGLSRVEYSDVIGLEFERVFWIVDLDVAQERASLDEQFDAITVLESVGDHKVVAREDFELEQEVEKREAVDLGVVEEKLVEETLGLGLFLFLVLLFLFLLFDQTHSDELHSETLLDCLHLFPCLGSRVQEEELVGESVLPEEIQEPSQIARLSERDEVFEVVDQESPHIRGIETLSLEAFDHFLHRASHHAHRVSLHRGFERASSVAQEDEVERKALEQFPVLLEEFPEDRDVVGRGVEEDEERGVLLFELEQLLEEEEQEESGLALLLGRLEQHPLFSSEKLFEEGLLQLGWLGKESLELLSQLGSHFLEEVLGPIECSFLILIHL